MAQADNPLVSVIVLCYNQAQFVLETLESVKAQTYQCTQLIIVDDSSADGSVEVIENWLRETKTDCTLIKHQENRGICRSLNEALAAATGKYIAMVASDDIWLPDKIALQVAIMDSQPEDVGVLYSDAFQIDEHGNFLPGMFIAAYRSFPEMPEGRLLDTLLEGNFIPAMTTLIRRSCYEKVGPYDENLPWEDWDMWMRIARQYSFIFSRTPSAKYRIHDKSLIHSTALERLHKDAFKIRVKQFFFGDLSEEKKSRLTDILYKHCEYLYSVNDNEVSDLSMTLLRVTGDRRARWMYRFAKCGISFRGWQRANNCLLRLRRIRNIVSRTA